MNRLSLTTRISVLFAAAVALVLLSTGVLLSQAVETHFVESDRHDLETHLALIRHLLEQVDSPQALEQLPDDLNDALVGQHGLAAIVKDTRGKTRFSIADSSFPPALLLRQDCNAQTGSMRCLGGALWQWRQAGHDYRGMVHAMRSGDGQTFSVGVALDIRHHEVFMVRFHELLGMAMALAALVTAALGWFATRRGLAPLLRVTDMASGISSKHLGSRLPSSGLPAELQTLVTSFNAMLARLDDAFTRLSEFSSDIAHELRTPVSNLMTQTHVALSRARSKEEYREILQSNAEEYERLARMIADMLFLAKADNRLIVPKRESVDLAQLTRELIEFHGIVAEEQAIRLEITGTASITGDRLMLQRALSNLLSNAIRNCPSSGIVHVDLNQSQDGIRIHISNPGSIPPDHLHRLFDRFYSGDPARRQESEGVGLGLAIVRSIIEAHGGSISASSEMEQIRFTIQIPNSPNSIQ